MGQNDNNAKTVRINIPESGREQVMSRAAPRSMAPALNVGSSLAGGRFSILRLLGEGGMGVVYEAFDAQRGEKVALKTLHRLDAAGIYQLKSEFRILTGSAHPHLVRLHELFAHDGNCFFTMDLVDGQCFDAWFRDLRAASRAGDDCAWVEPLRSSLAQLVTAIAAIHQHGKLHRDLKPSNVMVDAAGHLTVLDFGLTIAPRASPHWRHEALGDVSGTPAFMAPEQALGAEVSSASDYYAMGVMLFQVLTGSVPFRGSFQDIIIAKQVGDAPRVRVLAPDAPPDLADICDRLLSSDPATRPDAQELLAEFGEPARSARHVPSQLPQALPKLIGREVELARLRHAYHTAEVGSQPVVLILRGESGIGKSTLMAAFLDELERTRGAVVLRGRCYERETVPFTGFDEVVDDLSRYLLGMRRERLRELVPHEAWALLRLFPVLGRVPALASVPARHGAEPHEVRRRGFVALGALLRSLREGAPVVVFVDDLQCSDRDSVSLLVHLLRQADSPQLLFVGAVREGACPVLDPLYAKLPSDVRLSFSELSVEPLSPECAAELMGCAAPQQALREARGNPFLLGELARHFKRREPTHDACSLAEILWQRCGALPSAAQRLLHVVALAAGSLPLDVAVKAARVEPSAQDALQDAQLVRTGAREGEIECYHDKIRETVAGALPELETQELHQALARAWEATGRGDPEVVSIHFEHGGEPQRAAELSVIAARHASEAFAFERAVQLYARALSLGQFNRVETQRLRVARADVLAQAGRSLDAAEACLAAARELGGAESIDLTRRAGGFLLQCGRLEEALPLINQGLAPFGLSVAPSATAAVASMVLERTRLKLRGLAPSRRKNGEAASRFRAAEVIAGALPSLDPIRYPPLATRLLRLALDSGDMALTARGMASEVLVGLMLAQPDKRLRDTAARAHELCALTEDPAARFWLNLSLAILELNDNPVVSLRHLDTARQVLTQHPSPALSHLGVWMEWNRLQVLCLSGEFADVARQTPALLDDAWARDNRGVVPFLAGVPGAVARVAVQDLVGLRQDLDRASEAWKKESFTWQDIMQTQGELAWAAYTGETRRAQSASELLEMKFSKSLARHTRSVRGYVGYVSAWTKLAVARDLGRGPERQRLLREAERALKLCDSTRLAACWSSPLEPALEVLRGNEELAVTALRRLTDDPDAQRRLPVYSICARRGLGALLGGDEGAELLSQADHFLERRGVVDPARFVQAVAPGLAGAGK